MPWDEGRYSWLREALFGALVAFLVVWGVLGAPLP
jgi:hypothetical protein